MNVKEEKLAEKEDKNDELVKAAQVPDPSKSPPREIPKGGISLADRIVQGGKPPRHVSENPEQYYYDPETAKYPRRPEPIPDFEKGEQRAIPCFAS